MSRRLPQTPSSQPKPPKPNLDELLGNFSVLPLSRIDSQSVDWLWKPYLPRGKVVTIDGDPGIGKSLLTIDLAARLSRGSSLPDGVRIERPHTVLLFNAEDDAADTIRPRAQAAGADLERLIVMNRKVSAPFVLPHHHLKLIALIKALKADVFILDPFMTFIDSPQSEKCVARVLAQLQFVADRLGCTIILIRHLRKDQTARAIHRGMGSVRIIGKARIGLLASRHPTDPSQGVLAVSKTNVAGTAPAIGYRIKTTDAGCAVLEWTGPVATAADDLGQNARAISPRDHAAAWLHEQLAAGPRKAADIFAAAAAARITEKTLKRAKADLDVQTHRVSQKGQEGWYWYDPAAPWPDDAPFEKPWEPSPLEF